ncbi:hypothetical protein ADU90_06350 (plasmid) [Clostridium botulinum]|uniref:Phage portal protein n=1 Tax=Clostridium botulinum C/D str. DC5 TaxID=1443128 RepID=A0A0A0HXV3_CLOBO|nr:hypothetical protein [Clostridium botulinum]KGM93367.1 hypothetical protein Z955_15460 [Clostridium botulinum C/D str. DC5]KOC56950.1 hypothetical protein ADU89_01810 [Clostridium botulinum]KOC57425.1 hypothetical protein ADU90_06350 [Clostridium botulinum]MCD3232667.1 hypothetical protein [Clostridium botulinum D/C]MCD3238403.1 hypothetical protein [Clostridium botulinum D/C]
MITITYQKSLEELEQEKKQAEKQQLINFASNSVSNNPTSNSSKYKSSKMNITKVYKLLEDPIKNYKLLQSCSLSLMAKQGIYFRLIKYWSSCLTYDHLIYPAMSLSKVDKKEIVQESYEKCALYLDKMNLKFYLPYFAEEMFKCGEGFFYKLEDDSSIVFKQIPNSYCRISTNEDNVFRYEVNLDEFDDNTILDYPIEFQTKYNKYKSSTNKKSKVKKKTRNKSNNSVEMNNWVQISDKGVAFPTLLNSSHSYPPFCFLFPDVIEIDNVKGLKKDVDRLDNSKIIHNEIAINKDTGKPIMDLDLAEAYNKAIQKNLPEGIKSITNPFKTETINLNNAGNAQKNNIINDSTDEVYKNSGVSDLLFANKKASSEALKLSVLADTQILFSIILPLFVNYINYELKEVNPQFVWKVKMLNTSYFNADDKFKIAKDSLAYGGSRMEFFALKGFSPLETVNILKAEQTIGLDDLLIPAKTSHTLSDKDRGN